MVSNVARTYIQSLLICIIMYKEGKQHEKILAGLTQWLKIGQVTDVLKATRDKRCVKGHDRLR